MKMSKEQKRELQTIRANELFYAMTIEEREEVIRYMDEVLEGRDMKGQQS